MNPELEMRIWAIEHYIGRTETRNQYTIIRNILRLLLKGLSPHERANCPLWYAHIPKGEN